MSRRAFGGWGWELSGREFAQAVAALGVVAPVLQERGRLRPARGTAHLGSAAVPRRRTIERYELLLSDLVDQAAKAESALVWDVTPLGAGRERRSAILAGLPAAALAAAWSSSYARLRPLEIRTARWLDPGWTFRTLSQAAELGTPYFPVPGPGGRMRWNWPLRVGFLRDSGWLREDLYRDLGGTLTDLTEPETGPGRCDLLLIPGGVAGAMEAVEQQLSVPEAGLTLLLDVREEPEDLDPLPDLAKRMSAWGIASVRIPTTRADWYRSFLTELSHARPILDSARDAGGVVAVFAAHELAQAAPLPGAASSLVSRMDRIDEEIKLAARPVLLPPPTMQALRIRKPRRMRELGRRLETENLAFDSERTGATHVANVAKAAGPVLREVERRQALLRFIRAQVHDRSGKDQLQLRRAFRSGATHAVAVSIGPKDADWLAGDKPFPTEKLPHDPGGHRLTVVFAEPNLLPTPLVEKVELPPFGSSDAATFTLRVRSGVSTVEARITVLHRGRILQTAVLRGLVFGVDELARLEAAEDLVPPAIQVLIEAMLRPGMADLDDRTRFGAAIVLNHDTDGAAATAIGEKAARIALRGVEGAVEQIGLTFKRAELDKAFERPLDSKTSLGHLRNLALQGTTLHQRIGRIVEAQLVSDKPLDRIQVLSANPNTFVPVELIYDLPPPEDDAELCQNWRQALATGRCDAATFHRENEEGGLEVVCPAGFWGVSKVIERQAIDPLRLAEDPEMRGIDFAVLSVPDRDRPALGGLLPVLFAASEHVNDVDPKELNRVSGSLRSLTEGNLLGASSWKTWARQVKEKQPPILLLLSHTELNTPKGAALEIAKVGGRERRVVAQITKHHVNLDPRRPGPIVMLLGCTTAVPHRELQSFVVQFHEMGASLVVGTIAPILGRHAGRAAEALVEQIQQMAGAADAPERGTTFGDAMLAIRRELLAQGVLMSLCLTAYGDADWRIPRSA